MYDPTIGRWISQDPLGFDAGDSNLYRYAHNAPVTATDPSGLWYTVDHLVMQQSFLKDWFSKHSSVPLAIKNKVNDLITLANGGQDTLFSPAFNDYRRHFTRPYFADEVDVENAAVASARQQRGAAASAEFSLYIGEETDKTRNGNNIGTRLQALGRLTHAFQDFFGHAVRIDMKGNLRLNPLTGVRAGRCGSENSRWPGFSAFAVGVSGTPLEPGGLMPPSYLGVLAGSTGEHPGSAEPISPGTPEYLARWQAAVAFVYPLFDKYLTEIYDASGGFAPKHLLDQLHP